MWSEWVSSVWLIGHFVNLKWALFPFVDNYILLPGTGLNNEGSLYVIDDFGEEHLALKNIILPAITLGTRPLAIIVQLTRSSLLDVFSQDYVRTATAKGLSFYAVVFKHALKNALNPVFTAISGWFAGLMAGAVFVEVVRANEPLARLTEECNMCLHVFLEREMVSGTLVVETHNGGGVFAHVV